MNILIDVDTAEFVLDLPKGMAITDASFKDGMLIFNVTTELEIEDNSIACYDTDPNGNTFLVWFFPTGADEPKC